MFITTVSIPRYKVSKQLYNSSPTLVYRGYRETYQNSYALVMEDFSGISLKDYFTSYQMRHISFLQ